MFEGLVFGPELAFDRADAGLEANDCAFDVFDGVEDVAAKGGEHGGVCEDFEGGEVVVDEGVLVLPVLAADGGDARPKGKKEVIAFGELVFELRLLSCELLAGGLMRGLEFRDASVFLGDGAAGMLMGFLPLLVLSFVGSAALTLTFKKLSKLLRFKAVTL